MILSDVDRLFARPSSLLYWAIFRIYLCFHLINQLMVWFVLRDLLFTEKSFVATLAYPWLTALQAHFVAFLAAYLGLILLLALGVGRNLTALAVLASTIVIQSMNGYILNGGHNFLDFVLIYLCLANSFEHFVLRKSIRNSYEHCWSYFFTRVATACLIAHLCLVYFSSGIAKLHSETWYHGDAIYYILNLERFQGSSLNHWITASGAAVTLITYCVMFWELYFPALVWIPRFRVPVLLAGIAIHLGIWWSMMIYDFEMLFVMTYGFFFRDEELLGTANRVFQRLRHLRLASPPPG